MYILFLKILRTDDIVHCSLCLHLLDSLVPLYLLGVGIFLSLSLVTISETPTSFAYQLNISLTKEQIFNNVKDIIVDKEIGNNYLIKGEDFSIIIKPTNSTAFKNATYVDFDECEQVIRLKYNFTNSTIISFFQFELNNENKNVLYNQIKYFLYNEKNEILDLSLCENITTPIHYSIKEDNELDLEKIEQFKNKGIDIFNINDEFYNDLCQAYSESNNDMILEDRRDNIYLNYSLCEEGCNYENVDLDYMTVTCNCKIQENFSIVITPLIIEKANNIADYIEGYCIDYDGILYIEQFADPPALFFRLCDPCQGLQELLRGVHRNQPHREDLAEGMNDLLRLILSHQSMIHVHAGQALPHGPVDQGGRHSGVHPSGHANDHTHVKSSPSGAVCL